MPSRRGRRGRGGRGGIFRPRNTHDHLESCDSSFLEDDETHLCTWCNLEFRGVFKIACGHQYCRECVENLVLPISACPIDQRYACESSLTHFVLMETQEELSVSSSDGKAIELLRKRVDSLTLIVERLVEHLAIKNMINEQRLSSSGPTTHTLVNGFHGSVQHPELHKLPTIIDSDDSEQAPHMDGMKKDPVQSSGQAAACRRMDTAMLCNLPSENELGDSNSPSSALVLTPDNVRQLLPRFWAQAAVHQWSDSEKLQRLRCICSPALQRLLDNADLLRKDWAYVSSLLYGDHLMDELSMIRCLGSMKQRFGETPHQWYLRVSFMVERGLPPGPLQDWEIRSAFIRGLLPKYQEVLKAENADSITSILSRCAELDVKMKKTPTEVKEKTSNNRERLCFSCGEPGHILRDCTRQNVTPARWTPWN